MLDPVAYRFSEFRERCGECDRTTDARCRRCARYFCDADLFTDERLCEECESLYLTRTSAASGLHGAAVTAAMTAAGALGIAGLLLGPAALAFVVAGTAALVALDQDGARRRRRAFVDELRAAAASRAPRLASGRSIANSGA